MQGEWTGPGQATVVLKYTPENGDKLVSPDGTQHFIPCSNGCGCAEWKPLNVVSFICNRCDARRNCEHDIPHKWGVCTKCGIREVDTTEW